MDARDRFHLARAQAHLAAGDSSRAARHLNKCAFGIGKVPDAPVAAEVVRPINWRENWAKLTQAEKDAANKRGKERKAAVEAEQRAAYEEKRRVFERTTGAPRFGAVYGSAGAAADAFEKIPDAELASRQKAGDGLLWGAFKQAIVDARAAGDFNKVFNLAVRQPGFWNANDLGEGYSEYGGGPKSIAALIRSTGRGFPYKSADAAADAFEKIPDAELASRQKAGDGLLWGAFKQAIVDARTAGDFNKVFNLAVRQPGFWNANDLGEGYEYGGGPKSIAALIRSTGRGFPVYKSADAAADAFEKIPDAELASRQKAGDGLSLGTFKQAIADARAAGDFNKVFNLAVRQPGFWNANDLGEGYSNYGTEPKSIAALIRSTGKANSFGGALDFLWGG